MPHASDRSPGSVREAAGGLVALTAATFLAVTTEMLPVGLLPAIGHDMRVSDPVTGLLVTIYAFMVAVLAVPLTLSTSRFSRKGLLQATLVAYTVSNLLVAVAPDFGVLAAGRAFGGIAHALFFSVSIGYASRLVAPAFTGRALALVTAGAAAGFVLGVPLSTSLGTALGWRAAFGVLAGVCAITVVIVALLLPAVPGGGTGHLGEGAGARRVRLAVVSTTNAVVYLGQFTVYTFVSVILLATGLPAAGVGPVLLGIGAVGLLGTWFAAATLDRRPRATVLTLLGAVTAGLVGVGLAFPALAGVLAAAVVWGAGFGGVASVFQTAAIRTRGATPEVIGALVNATANVGIGAGAAVGAAVLAGPGLGWLPFAGAALIVVGLVIVLVARRSFPSSPEA
ncbi:MFS transporter [Leifsonia shinshuensis]|uniref:Putative MFS family arabinose efflux permease n=1 Tax=Leifsonia shinshuensis TaxID=150026 RepID=A0A853CYN2_9MICO|nr:MFS transporter [Leifsonia shinshuensis]NYJ25697.1 putative MFS family arabinose efflux permease [Leifsonia shinshuensis]